MKKIMLAIILLALAPSAFSAEKADIIAGQKLILVGIIMLTVEKLLNAYALSDKSNKSMDELIAKTVGQIKENNTGPVYKSQDPQLTIGDVSVSFSWSRKIHGKSIARTV
jgi:hypothetical protein